MSDETTEVTPKAPKLTAVRVQAFCALRSAGRTGAEAQATTGSEETAVAAWLLDPQNADAVSAMAADPETRVFVGHVQQAHRRGVL